VLTSSRAACDTWNGLTPLARNEWIFWTKRVMTRLGRGKEFGGLVQQTREENQRRKNVVAILDGSKLIEK
jgi:hypothetical protein